MDGKKKKKLKNIKDVNSGSKFPNVDSAKVYRETGRFIANPLIDDMDYFNKDKIESDIFYEKSITNSLDFAENKTNNSIDIVYSNIV